MSHTKGIIYDVAAATSANALSAASAPPVANADAASPTPVAAPAIASPASDNALAPLSTASLTAPSALNYFRESILYCIKKVCVPGTSTGTVALVLLYSITKITKLQYSIDMMLCVI